MNMLSLKRAKSIYLLAGICFLLPFTARAQFPAPDTLKLSLSQAEKIFLDSNLQLLAEHYNINSVAVLKEQAKKWDNPLLVTDQNIYSNKRFFHHGTAASADPGQIFVQVQQLIKTAGKRGKQIALAETNTLTAEWQFRSVMRDLRATLIKDFYDVARMHGNSTLFNDNLQRLENLRVAMDHELQSGNIARKEYLRVQALIVELRHSILENDKQLSDAEAELKTLLRLAGNVYVTPLVEDTEAHTDPAISIASILDSARHNNADYVLQTLELQYNQRNLALQKALAVPDVTVGPEYDQSSNYSPNYYGLTLNLPLPVFDRNRGNIKSAQWSVKREDALLSQADIKLQNDVLNAYRKLLLSIDLASGADRTFYKDYYELFNNVVESYNKRQIGMIEFLEYFNDYQEVKKSQLQQVFNLRMAKEELNEVVGVDVVK